MKTRDNSNRIFNVVITLVFSIIASIIIVVGHKFVTDKTIAPIRDYQVFCYALAFVFFVAFFYFLFYAISIINQNSVVKTNLAGIRIPWFHYNRILTTAINFFVVLLMLLPAYLAVFPGYQAYDVPYQVEAYLYIGALEAHHPIIHTLLVSGLYKLSLALTGEVSLGLFLYTIIQWFCVIVAIVYMVNKLIDWKVNDLIIASSLLLVLINPLFQMLVFSTTKDILFSAFFVMWIAKVVDLAIKEKHTMTDIILLFIFLLLTCLFRKQGIYIAIASFPIWIIIELIMKKWRGFKWKISYVLAVAVVLVFLGPISKAMNVIPDQQAEKLSLPVQQIARVVMYDSGSLSQETMEEIQEYLPMDILVQYIPEISDPVKNGFNNNLYAENKLRFWKLWWKVSKGHAVEYIDALLYGSVGYFYPASKVTNPWGYMCSPVSSPNVHAYIHSLFPAYYDYLSFAGRTFFNDMPIISNLVCIGACFWLILVVAYYAILKRKVCAVFVLLPNAIMYASLILGPVCCIRYVFQVVLVAPIMIGCLGMKKNE